MLREEFNEMLSYFTRFHGLFYQLWKMGIPRYDEKIGTAAVSFNKEGEFVEFILCKSFWDSKTLPQKAFIIAHECKHIILNHGLRSVNKQYDMNTANIAMDLVVNHGLVNHFGFKREEVDPENVYCWVDTVFKNYKDHDFNQSFEYYYTKLQKLENDSQSSGDMQRMSGGNQLVDNHDSLFDSEEILKKLGEKLTEEEKQSLSEKLFRGTEEGGMQYIVPKQKVIKKKKWETVIKKWANQFLKYSEKTHAQWIKTNRRYATMSRDFFLNSEVEDDVKHLSNNRITIFFFLDTSGSCYHLKDRLFRAAESLPIERFDVRLFCFDTKVYETDLKSRKVYGGGGTSFRIIETYIQRIIKKENIKYPKAVFLLTDGYADLVKPQFPKNWHWFLTGNYIQCIPKESHIYKLKDFE